ncbi:hypothetical protein N6G02_01120 [Cupriavidus gilardii]|uniref:hypothetical protein n=1 Tax=Cupriavidus gilardii TaxID=82541 RepID=UPI0021C14E98|nr:hypothetical protein [Cupriavidus gilardii]MCT9114721.1 hypothetical protein [Cupriavidus gilardii]
MQKDMGLVNLYLEQIRALAVRAQNGEDVSESVAAAVAKAKEHFSNVVGHSSGELVSAYVSQLKLQSHIAHESQPILKKTLLEAARLAAG